MRGVYFIMAIFAMVVLMAIPAVPAPVSLALNGNVYYFTDSTLGQGGWGSAILAPPSTVVDGVLLPEGTQWNQNTIW